MILSFLVRGWGGACGGRDMVEASYNLQQNPGESTVWDWGHLVRNYPAATSPGYGLSI